MNNSQATRFICHCLSLDENHEYLVKVIQQEAIDWMLIAKLSSQYLLTPALYWHCKIKQILAYMPNDFVTYLETIFELNKERNKGLLVDTRLVASTLNEIDVEPVITKGGASFLDETYPDIGIRVTGDIDVLVPVSRLDDCVEQLKMVDCVPMPHAVPYGHQYQELYLKETGNKIDLHFKVIHVCSEYLLSTDKVVSRRIHLHHDNYRLSIPCPTDRIMHNILHSQLADRNYSRGSFNLSQNYDFNIINNSLLEDVDWKEIISEFSAKNALPVLQHYLSVAKVLFGSPFPEGIKASKKVENQVEKFIEDPDQKWAKRWRHIRHFLSVRLMSLKQHPVIIFRIFTVSFYMRFAGKISALIKSN